MREAYIRCIDHFNPPVQKGKGKGQKGQKGKAKGKGKSKNPDQNTDIRKQGIVEHHGVMIM